MKNTTTLLLFATIIGLFTACKKYENGPEFSLLPKKERLANTWKMHEYSEDGVIKTTAFYNLFQDLLFIIEKDGSYSISYKPIGIGSYSETGTWRFVNNKKDIETNPSSGVGSVGVHHILKLQDDEFWYYDMDNGVRKEYHLIP